MMSVNVDVTILKSPWLQYSQRDLFYQLKCSTSRILDTICMNCICSLEVSFASVSKPWPYRALVNSLLNIVTKLCKFDLIFISFWLNRDKGVPIRLFLVHCGSYNLSEHKNQDLTLSTLFCRQWDSFMRITLCTKEQILALNWRFSWNRYFVRLYLVWPTIQ